MPDWKTMKLDAKAKIKATSPTPYTASVIFVLISLGVKLISERLNPVQNAWFRFFFRGFARGPVYIPTPAATVLDIILSILINFLTVGLVWYSLKISRSQQTAVSDLFEAFKIPLKVLWLSVLLFVFTLLWSLLLVIPGIIAAYSYSQAYNVLYDHPDYSAMQCIRESKWLMRGYKAELFGLDFSFIGWVLLGVITLGLFFIWLMPYMYVTRANFYNALVEVQNPSAETPENQNPIF